MESSSKSYRIPEIEDDYSNPDYRDNASLVAPMEVDGEEESISVRLESVKNKMRNCIFNSDSQNNLFKDNVLINIIPLASRLFIESFKEMENRLQNDSKNSVSVSLYDIESKLTSWKEAFEPWHDIMNYLRNLREVPSDSVECLLDVIPGIIQTVFTHCKRGETLYGKKFNKQRDQVLDLFRKVYHALELLFYSLENNINFESDVMSGKKTLKTVFYRIGDIAALSIGLALKTSTNIWKSFGKLAIVRCDILKKVGSSDCVIRHYEDMAKETDEILFNCFQNNDKSNVEIPIKCASLRLRILGRLCTAYRGYCGNKVFIVLLQQLTKLYRYSPPLASKRFSGVHSSIVKCSEMHIVSAWTELLKTLLDDDEFRKAFFNYGKLKMEDPICYHFLILEIIGNLMNKERIVLSAWLQDDVNIIDVALVSINANCAKVLIGTLQVTINSEVISDDLVHSDIYGVTLRLLCHLIARTSVNDFATVETTLVKHLVDGEFWSSLLANDLWTFLGRIAPPELCYEHLSLLIKVRKSWIASQNVHSFEFGIVSNLIERLFKLLPDGMKDTLFREIGDYSNRLLMDPFKESLPFETKQYLWSHPSVNTQDNLGIILQELRRSPSLKNWTRLTSLLKSIGATALPKDKRVSVTDLLTLWSLVAKNIKKSHGIIRDILLELTMLLFDCTRPIYINDSSNFQKTSIARSNVFMLKFDAIFQQIFKNMLEMTDYVLIEHRIRMNVFLRENMESLKNEDACVSAIIELFCCLLQDASTWVQQESFETYAEYILNSSNVDLFNRLSLAISQLPRICEQMSEYFSNRPIHTLKCYTSFENYLQELAEKCKDQSTWHKCYLKLQDQKVFGHQQTSLDERIIDICDEIQDIVKRRNELSDTSIDRLRAVLLKLLEPSGSSSD